MTFVQILVLSLVQGLAEFLPISSSGHLILVPILTGWPDQGLILDVAMHVGTLAAVLAYFWRDVWAILADLPSLFKGRMKPGARLGLFIVAATIPAVIAGLSMRHFIGDEIRNPFIVGWAMVGFAAVLYLIDKLGLTIWRRAHRAGGEPWGRQGCGGVQPRPESSAKPSVTREAGSAHRARPAESRRPPAGRSQRA